MSLRKSGNSIRKKSVPIYRKRVFDENAETSLLLEISKRSSKKKPIRFPLKVEGKVALPLL